MPLGYSLDDFPIIRSLILASVFYLLGVVIYNEHFHPLRKIPGPFLHRSTPFPWLNSWIHGSLHLSLHSLHEMYGEVVRITPNEVSFISERALRQIYGNELIIRDPFRSPRFDEDHDDIIVYSKEEDHVRLRKAFNHTINGHSLVAHELMVRKNTNILRAKLNVHIKEKNGIVDMTQFLNRVAFDIAGDLIWGESFGGMESSTTHPWLEITTKSNMGTLALLLGIYPWIKKASRSLIPRRILNLPGDIIKEKNRLHEEGGSAESVFSLINGKGGLTQQEIDTNLIAICTAATDTFANTILAALYFLARNQTCARRAREEIQAAFAAEDDISHPAVTKLPYINAIIYETFRLWPVLPTGLCRRIIGDGVKIDGISLPKDTVVRNPMYSSGHYSKYFREPEKFRPERWLGDPLFKSDNRAVVQPFLSGRHSCLGRSFAEIELTHILARMVWAYEFELEDGDFDFTNLRSNLLWERQSLNVRVRVI